MCGVAGILAYGGDPVDRSALEKMSAALAHRGPDGSGTWVNDDGRVALAHRRLSIIDLSERGAQPMASTDGRFIVSFNGEIYNHQTIRKELEEEGCVFRSSSDTEVLLHLFERRGEAMLDALRGMYAFAIVDRTRGRMFVARDPHGIKPLYVADDGAAVYVASEVKALKAAGVATRTSLAGMTGFLLFGSVPEPLCWYAGVHTLRAGHCAWIDERGLQPSREFASVAGTWAKAVEAKGDAADTVARALRDTVTHHLVSDVPVGAFLSAGVDSTTLVALMREAQGTVKTVTLTTKQFRGRHEDEAPWAERIADRYGAEHQTLVITDEAFRRVAPNILEAMDQPSIDGFNTWLVSRAAVQAGLKVAVSGLGGDELFGGYGTFTRVPRWYAAMRMPSRVPGLGPATRRLMVATRLAERIGVSPKLAGLAELGGTFGGAYFLSRGLFMPWELPALMGEDRAREGLRQFDAVAHCNRALSPDPQDAFRRVAVLEAVLYMRNQLLRDSDWASMAHSLEVRVPLVDHTLLSRIAPVSPQLGDGEGKRLMAQTPDEPLPAELVARGKTGFTLPLSQWLSEPSLGLDAYKRIDDLARPETGYARRLAYGLFDSLR